MDIVLIAGMWLDATAWEDVPPVRSCLAADDRQTSPERKRHLKIRASR